MQIRSYKESLCIIALCFVWLYARLETRAWYIRVCAFASANHIVKYALIFCVLVIAQGIIYFRELPSESIDKH